VGGVGLVGATGAGGVRAWTLGSAPGGGAADRLPTREGPGRLSAFAGVAPGWFCGRVGGTPYVADHGGRGPPGGVNEGSGAGVGRSSPNRCTRIRPTGGAECRCRLLPRMRRGGQVVVVASEREQGSGGRRRGSEAAYGGAGGRGAGKEVVRPRVVMDPGRSGGCGRVRRPGDGSVDT